MGKRIGGLTMSQVTRALANYRLCVPVFIKALESAAAARLVDPFSLRLVKAVDTYSIGTCTLLALSHCRYSEIEDIGFPEILTFQSVEVMQPKVNRRRKVDLSALHKAFKKEPVGADTLLHINTYEGVRYAIEKAKYRAKLKLPTVSKNSTHVFRHFWASWQNSQGVKQTIISKSLGHYSKESISSYIHDIQGFTL